MRHSSFATLCTLSLFVFHSSVIAQFPPPPDIMSGRPGRVGTPAPMGAPVPTTKMTSDDFTVISVKLDQVMQPKSATDTFVECTQNAACKAIIDVAAAYVGVDSSMFTSAVAAIAESKAGEESRFAYKLPSGYQYCRAKVETVSVVPATGDRASFMSIDADAREVRAYTWTPRQNLGNGRSWIEANFTIIGVKDNLVQQYRSNGRCKAAYIRAECRGARGVNKGVQACGNITD